MEQVVTIKGRKVLIKYEKFRYVGIYENIKFVETFKLDLIEDFKKYFKELDKY